MDTEIRYLVVVPYRFHAQDDRRQSLNAILENRGAQLRRFAEEVLLETQLGYGRSLRILPAVGAIIVEERLVRPRRVGEVPLESLCHVIKDVEGMGDALAPSRILAPLKSVGLEDVDRTGTGVLVGVVDSGFEPARNRDDSRILAAWEFTRRMNEGRHYGEKMNPVKDRNEASLGRAFSNHGTRMCDLIATGRKAIAPSAKIAVATALTCTARDGRPVGALHQIVGGLEWLLTWPFRGGQLGCDVINLSYVFGRDHQRHWLGLVQLLTNASICNKLIVHAVGNDGDPTLDCPMTNDADVLSVGSVIPGGTKWDTRNNYNVVQQRPDLCAPATSSSYATAIISGIAALCVQKIGSADRRAVRKAVCSLAVESVQDLDLADSRLRCRAMGKVSMGLTKL